MGLAAITAGIFVYFLILSLISPTMKDRIKAGERLERLSREEKSEQEEELSKPFRERFLRPLLTKSVKVMTGASPDKGNGRSIKLENDLRLAGIFLSPAEFTAIKRIVFLVCLVLGVALLFAFQSSLGVKLLILLFFLVLGYLIPRYYLQGKIKKRQNEIRGQIPDVMDLLSVSVEAGLGFDAALLRVGEHFKGALIDELLTVNREIQIGKPRREAFKSLGSRSNVEELKTFAGAMVQAEQLGISIKNVLRLQAQQLRLRRRQSAEEKAMKAPVKMMLPLVIFILPVLFIILLGPSVIRIMEIFAK